MKQFAFIIVSLFIAMGITACDTTKKQLKQVSMESIDSVYTIHEGETVVIALKSNPSTGYKWNLSGKSEDSVVKLASREYKSEDDNNSMVGAGGIDEWAFTGNKKGEVVLLFKYEKEDGDLGKESYQKIIVEKKE